MLAVSVIVCSGTNRYVELLKMHVTFVCNTECNLQVHSYIRCGVMPPRHEHFL